MDRKIHIAIAVAEPGNHLPAAEFALLEGIGDERALARISSGYYQGGRCAAAWYIQKSELATGTA